MYNNIFSYIKFYLNKVIVNYKIYIIGEICVIYYMDFFVQEQN